MLTGFSTVDPCILVCVGLDKLQSTFSCLKVTPFNFPSADAHEVEQKLKDAVPNFEPVYFRKLNFDQPLVSVFGFSKFQEIIVSTFAECTCATCWFANIYNRYQLNQFN